MRSRLKLALIGAVLLGVGAFLVFPRVAMLGLAGVAVGTAMLGAALGEE